MGKYWGVPIKFDVSRNFPFAVYIRPSIAAAEIFENVKPTRGLLRRWSPRRCVRAKISYVAAMECRISAVRFPNRRVGTRIAWVKREFSNAVAIWKSPTSDRHLQPIRNFREAEQHSAHPFKEVRAM